MLCTYKQTLLDQAHRGCCYLWLCDISNSQLPRHQHTKVFLLKLKTIQYSLHSDFNEHHLHKLPIYIEYMCLWWVSALFGMIFCLFFNWSKNSTTELRSLYNVYLCCKCATFLYARTPCNAMRRSIEICLL